MEEVWVRCLSVNISESYISSPPQIPLPPRPLPLKMRPQTTLLEMLPDPTLSTCSWVSELHGPWPPSTGSPRARPSMSPSEGLFAFIFFLQQLSLHSLGFSVTIFCLEALCAILILLARRHPAIGGELGGPKFFKTISSSIFVFFWCFYVMISALEMYDVIEPGF